MIQFKNIEDYTSYELEECFLHHKIIMNDNTYRQCINNLFFKQIENEYNRRKIIEMKDFLNWQSNQDK